MITAGDPFFTAMHSKSAWFNFSRCEKFTSAENGFQQIGIEISIVNLSKKTKYCLIMPGIFCKLVEIIQINIY